MPLLLSGLLRRAPQGARGLKFILLVGFMVLLGRAPQGARGLKSSANQLMGQNQESRPARGAWVEIMSKHTGLQTLNVAPRKGRVG